MMRLSRLRRMYLPRTPKKAEKDHPMQVQNSQDFLRAAFAVGVLTFIAAVVASLRQVQARSRQANAEVSRKRVGQKVIIIGGGAGGAATAALLCTASPDTHVTVIEKDRQQVFQGHVALAHVGHRSYDLTTTTGLDTLRSPASWNVTRDANLVAAEVLRVDPEEKKVYVRSSPGMLAAAKPLSEEEAEAYKLRQSHGFLRRLQWWRPNASQPAVLSTNDDGSCNLSDGTTVLSYDALVVAAGAERSLGALRDTLSPQQVDSYRIAVNPGTTRDSLANMFNGNVLYVKVPPASFVWQMEAARALLGRKSGKGNEKACVAVDLTGKASAGATAAASTAPSKMTVWEQVKAKLDHIKSDQALRRAHRSGHVSTESCLADEVAQRVAALTGQSPASSASSAASWPLFLLSQWCMHFSSRQHDSTFVSSVNTILKYLGYYNKLSLCQLFAVTADLHPIGPAPPEVNAVIEKVWRERQEACQVSKSNTSSSLDAERLHVLYHSYLTSVDTAANTATLYDFKNNADVVLPYQLMVLDLPMRAPAFVRQSGLHRTRYVEECVLPALTEGTRSAAAGASDAAVMGASTSPSAAAPSSVVTALTAALRRHPLLGKSKSELEAIFADEASFMDVDATTLQHRRYPNVFAVGDVAGVPSVKSYGAVFAQVPVVAHNVGQFLKAHAMEKVAVDAAAEGKAKSLTTTAADAPLTVPQVNARYNGYSSFHVVMSTWRAMWPEMTYTFDPYQRDTHEGETLSPLRAASASAGASPARDGAATTNAADGVTAAELTISSDADDLSKKAQWDVSMPLPYCNHHVWDNLAWRDVRGFLNGLYVQSSLYEVMYFFMFTRGQWHSPTWFSVPTYSPEGLPCVPSLFNIL